MRSQPEFSPQTLSVLAALCEEPSAWQHGYALARQTGLKSGTLYPILIRLADRGLVEACWQEEPVPAGRAATCTGSRPTGWPAPRRRPRRSKPQWSKRQRSKPGRNGPLPGASGREPATGARCRGARGAMSRLGRIATTAGRAAMRLIPAARRDSAEAIWAEAHEGPAGWQRLAWREARCG